MDRDEQTAGMMSHTNRTRRAWSAIRRLVSTACIALLICAVCGSRSSALSARENLAHWATHAYQSLTDSYWGKSTIVRSCVTDIDGNGIPELILVVDKDVTLEYEGRAFNTKRVFYSVYTYGDRGVKPLFEDRITSAVPASGSQIIVGVDHVDGKPMVVIMCGAGPTGCGFGDRGYEWEIEVQAVDPFSDAVLSELYQKVEGSTIVSQYPADFDKEVGYYEELTLDKNGMISFLPTVRTQDVWR